MRASEFIDEVYDRDHHGIAYDIMRYQDEDPNKDDSSKSYFDAIAFTYTVIEFHDQLEYDSKNFKKNPREIYTDDEYDDVYDTLLKIENTVASKIPECYTANAILKILFEYLNKK